MIGIEMLVTVTNSTTTIHNPSEDIRSDLINLFTFKDKSKEYQVSKMARNPYTRNSKAYHQMKAEISQCLVGESDDHISFPTGLLELSELTDFQDQRSDTGNPISLPWAISKVREPRPYQLEAIDVALKSYRGMINIATGLGKSLIALNITRSIKRKTLIIAPSKGIAKQLFEEFSEHFGKTRVGFYGDGKKKLGDITIGIAATVINHIEVFKAHGLGLVIVDESHRSASSTFSTILESLSGVGRIYGLTATAFRSDGKDLLLTACCGPVLIERDAKWGIENGYLAKPVFLIRKIRTNAPDYDDKLLAYKSHILSAKEINERIEQDAQKMIAAGKSTLILVDSIEHGEALSKALGVPFAKGEDKQSEQYLKDLNAGKIPGLVGTEGKLSEGVDTRRVDCLILATFTLAKGAVMQSVGRGLRKQDEKTSVIILDYWPTSSRMLSRHAEKRVSYYQEITDQVKIV
jgi:superfamily II DNA or RNA helicase